MFAALILGLLGSAGHCAGMCSGVALMLGRRDGASGWRVLLLHLGRITTYGLMGLIAGAFGHALAGMGDGHGAAIPGIAFVQGGLALIAAALAIYMAVAFVGRAPSPELLLSRVTRWWGRTVRRFMPPGSQNRVQSNARHPLAAILNNLATVYAMGLLWGLLPCGLVMMALLLAAATGSAQQGALTMVFFGLGTWPLMLGVSLAPRLQLLQRTIAPWVRPATAAIIMLFGVQMALRGLAAWGVVDHLHVGGLALW